MKLLSRLFIVAGILLYAFAVYQIALRENPKRLAFDNYIYGQNHNVTDKNLPTEITIKDLDIDLPVYPSVVTNNQWQTTNAGASYLTSSPLPGTKGNSIVYAHNWRSLFGNLVNAHVGEQVIVTYPNNTKKTFVIAYTSVVDPNQSTILAPSNDKRITLYTCTGILDSKRFVAVAILKS
ncbi:MAG: sortase [Candidatus Levyibacteriota bacterium]